MKKVRTHRAAEREINEALLWYAEVNPMLWHRFQNEVLAAIDAAASHPLCYPTYLYGTRRVLLKDFPYLVVFLDWKDEIFVIAVTHGKRDVGYWKSRLPLQTP